MNKLFRFNVTKDTGNAAIAGLTMIVFSLMMIPFGSDSVRGQSGGRERTL